MKPRHCLLAVQIGGHRNTGIRDVDKGNLLRAQTGLIMRNLDAAQRATSVEIDRAACLRGSRDLVHDFYTGLDPFRTSQHPPFGVNGPKGFHAV